MKNPWSRREFLKTSALVGGASLASPLWSSRATAADTPTNPAHDDYPIAPGPFEATRESLKRYRCPEWFRDAKFGMWAHWGPQSAPEVGDWYARNMYIQGHRHYEHHLKTYGHPSKSGYKDVIPTWKAENFDPDYLLGLYRKAGAKFFVSMGVHHDNFDLWNSRHQPRWNSVAIGPRKNIAQMFKDAAVKHGLRFGVSQHLHASYEWMSTCFGADKTGPLAGAPYDGNDPQFADLYHPQHEPAPQPGDVSRVPESWKQQYLLRLQDLVDQLQPDLLYHDGVIRFERYGLKLVAHLYNRSAQWHGGAVEAVYNSKGLEDCQEGTAVLDFERGIAEGIWPNPFQTDTCVAGWHYDREARYRTPKQCVDLLVDVVSRNGTLLLNFPLRSDGTLDATEMNILAELTAWIAVHGEGIYGTRPWKICGEGPSVAGTVRDTSVFKLLPPIPDTSPGATRSTGARDNRAPLTARDVRFTTKDGALYAFLLGRPANGAALLESLATRSPQLDGRKVADVSLLGGGRLAWTQTEQGLAVKLPEQLPSEHAIALKIAGALGA
ncbi:MAG TPA: alpha-L-fucosidase [Opitutaceae bacterium]|nr:alpha-L-fucosidase [Opitutaceae bacterium]